MIRSFDRFPHLVFQRLQIVSPRHYVASSQTQLPAANGSIHRMSCPAFRGSSSRRFPRLAKQKRYILMTLRVLNPFRIRRTVATIGLEETLLFPAIELDCLEPNDAVFTI